MGVHVSSNINEVIRAILNLFFLQEDFTHKKSRKRIQPNKNKKENLFYEHKKHLRGRKSLAPLFAFCASCPFYAFYTSKKHLRRRTSLVCFLCFLCFLCLLCFLFFLCFLCFLYLLCFLCM